MSRNFTDKEIYDFYKKHIEPMVNTSLKRLKAKGTSVGGNSVIGDEDIIQYVWVRLMNFINSHNRLPIDEKGTPYWGEIQNIVMYAIGDALKAETGGYLRQNQTYVDEEGNEKVKTSYKLDKDGNKILSKPTLVSIEGATEDSDTNSNTLGGTIDWGNAYSITGTPLSTNPFEKIDSNMDIKRVISRFPEGTPERAYLLWRINGGNANEIAKSFGFKGGTGDSRWKAVKKRVDKEIKSLYSDYEIEKKD